MSWLLIGGGGYIGSHVAEKLIESGCSVIIADQNKARYLGEYLSKLRYILVDATDTDKMMQIIKEYSISGIINFAALKSVSDSFKNPREYNRINHEMPVNMIDIAISEGIPIFIQASTAAVYGLLESGVAKETDITDPISPYGVSKLAAEEYLTTKIQDGKITGVSLRYFNVGGSVRPSMRDNSTENILPLVLKSIQSGRQPKIFGNDYATYDGTAVRDYVHVSDIAHAHVLAITKLRENQLSPVINLGSGQGVSVLALVSEMLNQLGAHISPVIEPRREGDIASLVADISLATMELDYSPRNTLADIIESSVW